MNNDPWADFLIWERASRDTIDFKTIYVDMADDLIAGLLLSQIVYWYLPSKKGGSKLRVFKDGYYWIAKARHDWWDEIRVKTRQIDRAIAILEEKGIIVSHLYRFNNAPTTHIRIIKEGFLAAWDNALVRFDEMVKSETSSDPFSPNLQFDLTDSASGFDETVISDLPENVQSLTETTIDLTETTAENTNDFPEKNSVVEAIIEQTKTHPSPEDLARITEAKQAEEGNYATPAHAGGADALADAALFALYAERGKKPPKKGTKQWQRQRSKVAEALAAYGYEQASPSLVEKAAALLCERKGDWTNVFHSSFPMDFGQALSDAEGVSAKIPQRAAPRQQPENALLSQEALQERRAALPPPPQDDIVGQNIKDLLQAYVTRPTFLQYVKPCRFACNDGALVITAPDTNKRDWLENRLGVTIERALAGVADGPGEVIFGVKEVSS